jgi:hypothetical protein
MAILLTLLPCRGNITITLSQVLEVHQGCQLYDVGSVREGPRSRLERQREPRRPIQKSSCQFKVALSSTTRNTFFYQKCEDHGGQNGLLVMDHGWSTNLNHKGKHIGNEIVIGVADCLWKNPSILTLYSCLPFTSPREEWMIGRTPANANESRNTCLEPYAKR